MCDFRKILENTLGRRYIDNIVEEVKASPPRFAELYALTKEKDEKIAWKATWACEKLSIKCPALFNNIHAELISRAMQCDHGGQRRLLLNVIFHLPILEPISVEFLDFCIHGMLSPTETTAGQAICMKLAYSLCLKEPELMGELQAYLENMEPEYYPAAVQCTRNNILKKMRK